MSIKLVGKNTAIYAVGNIILRAASFLLIPLYTYSFSVSNYGIIATLLITIQIMVMFMSMGMRTCIVRFTKEYEDNNQIKDLLGTTTFINFVGGLIVANISILFLLPFFRKVLHTENVHSYMVLTCCAALGQSVSMHIISYYRARNEAFKFMIASISAAVVIILANLVFLQIFRLGINGVLLAHLVTYSAIFLFVLFDVSLKTGLRISLLLVPKLLRFGFPLVFSMSGQFIIGGAGIYFLSYFAGLESVAIYSLGYKIAQSLVMAVILPFQIAFSPYIFTNLNRSDLKQKISQIVTYLAVATTFMSFCILLGSRVLLPLIAPPEYSSAFLVILLLLPGTAVIGIYYIGETLLNAAQKTYIIGTTVTIGAILSIILNYILIPFIGWYGSVISFNFSFFLISLLLFFLGTKVYPISIEWKRLRVVASIFGVFLLSFYLLKEVSIFTLCVLTPLVLFICMYFVHFAGFFSDREKNIIKTILCHLNLRGTL